MKRHLTILLTLLCLGYYTAHAQDYVTNFNGLSSYVDLGTSVGNQGIRTIEFKFSPTADIDPFTPDPGYSLLIRNDDTQYTEYGVYIRGTDWSLVGGEGYLYFFIRYNGTLHEIRSNQDNWLASTCYHVAGVIDSVNGMMLYINGVLQSQTDPVAVDPVLVDNVKPTHIGNFGDAMIRYFDGRINDMSIWDQALTQTLIQTHMTLSPNPTDPGLIAYYPFNEGTGVLTLDATSNGYDGIASGISWSLADKCLAVNNLDALEEEDPSASKVILSALSNNGDFQIICDPAYNALTIVNALGQEILSSPIEQGTAIFSMTSYANGIYYALLSNPNGTYHSIKFIKQG